MATDQCELGKLSSGSVNRGSNPCPSQQRCEAALRLNFSQASQYLYLVNCASNRPLGRLITHIRCVSHPRSCLQRPIFLHRYILRPIATAHGLRYRGAKCAYELFPPVVTNKGEGIRLTQPAGRTGRAGTRFPPVPRQRGRSAARRRVNHPPSGGMAGALHRAITPPGAANRESLEQAGREWHRAQSVASRACGAWIQPARRSSRTGAVY